MKQRQLGKNGPKVSALGLGCMGMTGFYGEADEPLAIDVVQKAYEEGVTFFDTADMYGNGANELLLGKKDNLTTAADGKRYKTKLYDLSMILAIGYKVESPRGVQFRRWATTHLQEYLVKGFVMDDARLKEPKPWDYFDEWLERIREILASEKRFYQKVRDIYATALDYDPKSEQAQLFFKKVQNKMLWATTHRTAAELIVERANSELLNDGS